MVTKTPTDFPNLKDRLNALVEEHKQLHDEPLLLAIYYAPKRNPNDVFLFEVVENFGGVRPRKKQAKTGLSRLLEV